MPAEPRHPSHWTHSPMGVPPPLSPDSAADPASATLAGVPIDGLLVDTGGVLYDDTLWRRWLWRLVHHLGVAGDYEHFFAAWDRDYASDVNCGRREHSEALASLLLAAGITWPQIDEVEAASRIERQSCEHNLRPFAGVVRTLGRLSLAGLPLVAWADAPYPAAILAQRLEHLGLCGSFRAVLSSFDLEAAQPAPQCYQAGLQALGTEAAQTLYVGHLAAHRAGAKAAGMRTAAFNHATSAVADHYLARFDDLLGLIDIGCRPAAVRPTRTNSLEAATRQLAP